MYQIYPTLLDSFQRYLDSEESERQELIDKINRVPFVSEAADKGTAFNDLVDVVIKQPGLLNTETIPYNFVREDRTWAFSFRSDIVKWFVDRLKGAIPQVYTDCVLMTKYGEVNLYGYADELNGPVCYDIKTTSRYEFPKYLKNWQHRAYLVSLNKSGYLIPEFQYLTTDFNNTFVETYLFNERMEQELILICERLIEFIESERGSISNEKIYGLQKAETI